MPAPTITPLPDPPSRSNAPELFITRADAFVGGLVTFRDQLVALGTYLDALAESIDGDQAAIGAAIAAALAQMNLLLQTAGFTGTSTTSLTIGTGSKSLTIQSNRSFVVGTVVNIASTADPANFMAGTVTSYNLTTGALVVSVAEGNVGGLGTFAAWTVSLAGPRGPVGPAASINLTAVAGPAFAFLSGGRYRLTGRVTAGTLPVSPGIGGDPIEIMTGTDATALFHTITPNGAETVTVAGVAGSPLLFDAPAGSIIKLVPVAGGWQQGQ